MSCEKEVSGLDGGKVSGPDVGKASVVVVGEVLGTAMSTIVIGYTKETGGGEESTTVSGTKITTVSEMSTIVNGCTKETVAREMTVILSTGVDVEKGIGKRAP